MSGTGDSTTTTQSGPTDPKVGQTLDQLLGGIQDVWKTGPQVYPHSLYSPPGATTQSAWNQGSTFANGLLNSGGLTSGQQSANRGLSNIGAGYAALGDNNGLTSAQSGAQGMLGHLYGSFGSLADNNGLTAAQGTDLGKLTGLGKSYAGLSGAYDQNAPGYQTLRNKLSQDALSSVNTMFGGSGRLGSGLDYQQAATGVANALAPLDYQNYQNSVNNKYKSIDEQQGLLGNAFNMAQTGVGNQANAFGSQANIANSIFGNSQTGVSNQANSLAGQQGIFDQLFNNGQQGVANQNNALATLGGIGSAQDANRQGILTGNANLWDAQHNGKLGLLSQIMAALNGSAQLGGTTQTQTTNPSLLQLLLGGAIGIGGLAGL